MEGETTQGCGLSDRDTRYKGIFVKGLCGTGEVNTIVNVCPEGRD